MFNYLFGKLFGTRNDRYIKTLRSTIKKINALEPAMQALADEELAPTLATYRERVQKGEKLDAILPEVFALVREASRRILNMRHYDVQLIGGMVLHSGKIAEMKTGEGKTLVATLPVVLNALEGKGVHVVTVNDYLASRDSEWMGKLYKALGLTVGVIVHGLSDEERQVAYAADITYGTNNEFGFDYLRDNMKFYAHQLVQRSPHYAIVDEVDSILIDEARTPLIISGASDDSVGMYRQMDEIVRRLVKDTHFTMDEKARTALLTEEGVAEVEKLLQIDNLFDPNNISFQHHILQSLKAHHAYKRDVDYIVNEEDKVLIVDEFTGRLMPGRRFGDGLHQALEAKERVKVEAENQTLASITFQNYFRMYAKLSGMTGTAQTEAVEFQQIYGLETISIPPHKPMIRKDHPDSIYRTQREKFNAIVMAIKEFYATGQPVLVGTISIENSELISTMLKKERIPHQVLNAKHHAEEAAIIAQAGQKGNVTIATNMAGRGTDIVLGEGVRELGGLHILGTERHESRRIDNQLRGRSGRQGDPGSSRFYLSLEDNLMRIFGSERISNLMGKLGMEEGEPIENSMVSKAIESAQKRVESHNFDIRKTLLDYDNVMNQQREAIYGLRRDIMLMEDSEAVLTEFTDNVLGNIYTPLADPKQKVSAEDKSAIILRLLEACNLARALPNLTPESEPPAEEEARSAILSIYASLKEDASSVYDEITRFFLLESLDRAWKEHLRSMDYLREGIGLRGYAQRDPKLEYKKEGFDLFQDMLDRVYEGSVRSLTHIRVQTQPVEGSENEASVSAAPVHDVSLSHAPLAGLAGTLPPEQPAAEHTGLNLRHREQAFVQNSGAAAPHAASVEAPKVGRNDPCPCGSGKKYKKCHGA